MESHGSFPLSVDVSCADRAAANNSCEDGLYAETVVDGLRIRMPCVAHIGATSTGMGLQVCAKDVSGSTAFCLAMDAAGQAKELREIIIAFLIDPQSTEVIDAEPQLDGHEQVQYLRELLVLCMPCSDEGKGRALVLLSLLTSDIREPFLQLRVRGGARNICLKTWATSVAWNLLPSNIRLFPRHRWCSSLSTFQALTLLSCVHDLLRPAGMKWLGGRADEVRGTPAVQGRNVRLDGVDVGQLPESADSEPNREHVIVEQKENQPVDWALFNKKQKSKSIAWLENRPIDRLLVLTVCLSLGVHFLRVVEHVASDRWKIKAFADECSTGVYNARVLAASSGIFTRVVTDAQARLFEPESWGALRPLGRTVSNSCLAFARTGCTVCALYQLILRHLPGFPWKLFLLITMPSHALADEILNAPKCMLDEFTRLFLRRFCSRAALLSNKCRAILLALAVFLRYLICRIECRHSYLRKFVFASASWKPTLELISSM